jgi:hypothetical protein
VWVDTHGAAVHPKLMKGSLFQILMMEMFQMDVRTHDERYLLSHQGLNQNDGSNHCAMTEMVFQE